MKPEIQKAAELIKASDKVVAFTGAGISVESGIPPFRGENGLWRKYDPMVLDINYFHSHPLESWKVIKEIFYDFFGKAKPNIAHLVLSKMEANNLLQAIITQNIDNLHFEAGNKTVYEFHGNSRDLVCTGCGKKFEATKVSLENLPPVCDNCGKVLKPDFIFFGEAIPEPARTLSFQAAESADTLIVIGTTGEIMPASLIPLQAKESGAKIIEINPGKSSYTDKITDVYINAAATQALSALGKELGLEF